MQAPDHKMLELKSRIKTLKNAIATLETAVKEVKCPEAKKTLRKQIKSFSGSIDRMILEITKSLNEN